MDRAIQQGHGRLCLPDVPPASANPSTAVCRSTSRCAIVIARGSEPQRTPDDQPNLRDKPEVLAAAKLYARLARGYSAPPKAFLRSPKRKLAVHNHTTPAHQARQSGMLCVMGLPARDVFDSLGKDYETAFAGITAQREEAKWLANELPANARVLDVGCGTGRPVTEVLTAAGHRVTGCDVSPTMIEIARTQIPGATFDVADLRTLEQPPSSWDAVVVCYSLLQLTRVEIDAALAKFGD